jgi:hypothetical protein
LSTSPSWIGEKEIQMAYSQAEGGRETGKSTTREACSREREEIVAKP